MLYLFQIFLCEKCDIKMKKITNVIFIFIFFFKFCFCFKNNFESNFTTFKFVSEYKEVNAAINTIYQISKNVKAESPLTDFKTWKNYLKNLDEQVSYLVGNEQTFDYNTAKNVADSTLSTLCLLLPLDQIWSKLESFSERLVAGQRFLTIVETISVMMNIQVYFSTQNVYWYISNIGPRFYYHTFHFADYPNINQIVPGAIISVPVKNLVLPNNISNGKQQSSQNISAITVVWLPNLRHYMNPLVNDSESINSGVFPSVIAVKFGGYRENLPIKNGYKFRIQVFENDSLAGFRQCAFLTKTENKWLNQGCIVSNPTTDGKQVCECNHISGIGFGAFDDSYQMDNYEIFAAIKDIYQIKNNVSVENPIKNAKTWQNYLQNLDAQISIFKSKELIFSLTIAKQIAESTLNTLELLLPLDKIWVSLTLFNRLEAGQYFLSIIETLSVMMNLQVHQNNTNFYNYSTTENTILFQTKNFENTESYQQILFKNFATVSIPSYAISLPDNKMSSSFAMTLSWVANLRQYMTPLNNVSEKINPSMFTFKLLDYKNNILNNNSEKFIMSFYENTSLVYDRKIAFWTPNADNVSINNWSSEGCNASNDLSNSFLVYECDHISGIGFGVFDNLFQIEDEKITAAINSIHQIKNNVSTENSLISVKTWRNYLQKLDAQVSIFIGKELTFSYNKAEQVVESTLNSLELLLPLDNVWSSLTLSNRLEAGQYFLSIIETVSVLMNFQVHQNNKKFYNYSTTNNTILFQTKNFEYSENYQQILFENFAKVIIPSYALARPDNETSNSFAMTLSWMANLRQYMTMLNNFLEKVNPSMFALKISDNKNSILTNNSEKFLITVYENASLVNDRKIAYLLPNAENVNINNWSSKGCNALKNHFDDILVYKCDHIAGIGFGIFEHSQPQDVNPDEIANEIEQVLENIIQIGNNLSTEQWNDALINLTHLISNLTFSDDVIANVTRLLAVEVTNSSLNAFNHLIETPKNVWQNLTINEQKNAASKILKSISNLSILMNSKQTTNIEVLQFNSIELRSKAFSVNQTVTFNFNNATTIELPVKSVLKHSNFFSKNDFQVAFSVTLIKSLSQHLNVTNFLPNSDILSVTVANHRESINLNDRLKLKFVTHHNVLLVFRDRPLCSFWNLTTNDWSTDGCKIINKQSNRSSTACECNHLTDLSIIVDVSNREKPSQIKTIFSYISSSFSSIFLAMTIAFSLKFNYAKYTLYEDQFNVKKNRFWLNLNLTIWLLVSHLLIMFGMDRNEIKEICQISSLALFYSLLTTFCFSLMISVHLYLTSLEKLLFCYFSLKKFVLFAYVFPFVFILFSMILIFFLEVEKNFKELFESMTGEYFCWISSSQYPSHVWLFVGPMTVIIYANCCLLCATLLGSYLNKLKKIKKKNNNENEVYEANQHSTSSVEVEQNSLNNHVNWHMVLVLLFNFGLPWMLYVFYINEQMAPVFSYVFILLNGTQGVSLFAEQYYVYNRNYYKKKI